MATEGLRTRPQARRKAISLACLVGFTGALSWWGADHYGLTPVSFGIQAARTAAAPIFRWIYSEDLEKASRLRARYWHGAASPGASGAESWAKLQARSSYFHLIRLDGPIPPETDIPYVYESADAPHLIELRERYGLAALVEGAPSEYEAMLRLGSWVGTRWDHGTDPVPGGAQVSRVADVIAAGEEGARFWCEIAARTMAHSAAALGWPSRVVSLSRDGYRWEHAVTELWSNEYGKWFVIDTDFNLVYESREGPLSAFELVHDGLELQKAGILVERPIARAKPNLPRRDLLEFYRYAHIDLRNDWATRVLRPGSPAGGDLATWWTARPDLDDLLAARVHVDEVATFDWPVNTVSLEADSLSEVEGGFVLAIRLGAYSPYFERIELSLDGARWRQAASFHERIHLRLGSHDLRARVFAKGGRVGPERIVKFELRDPPDGSR